MRTLVLGGTGAVGRAAAAALRDRGHEAVVSGRSVTGPGTARLDLATPEGAECAAEFARSCDAVIDASGREAPGIAAALPGVPYVDISASGSHLEALRALRPAATLVLGAGIAPGLSTVLAASLEPLPGDDLDIAVMLGTGEAHGPAAVAWTAGLAGSDVHLPPEGRPVRNLRELRRFPVDGRNRIHLRADFPDHVLLAGTGARVRSYLALGSPVATAGLALVGAAPALRGILAAAPHWGDDRWVVAATNRRSGERVAASGAGQSRATGEIAALAAIAAAEQPGLGAVTMAELLDLEALGATTTVALAA